MKLSEAERAALAILHRHGGSILTSLISDRNSSDEFGFTVPGMAVFRKLDKAGLANITEEDEGEDGFTFTPSIEITPAGRAALKDAPPHD